VLKCQEMMLCNYSCRFLIAFRFRGDKASNCQVSINSRVCYSFVETEKKNVIVLPVLERLVIFFREATLEIPMFSYFLYISSQKIRIGSIN
jgi:hypothetical protein